MQVRCWSRRKAALICPRPLSQDLRPLELSFLLPAAAGVEFVEQADGGGDFLGGAGSLYPAWGEDDFQGGIASLDHVKHGANGCASRRGNQPEALRITRQLTLSFRREESLGFKFLLEFFKSNLQRADALQLEGCDAQLILAARLINGHFSLNDGIASVLQERAVHLSLAAKENATQLRAGIFKREINVARTLDAQIGDFARHPDLAHLFFQQPPDLPRQFRHRQDFARPFGREQLAEVPLGFGWFAHRT